MKTNLKGILVNVFYLYSVQGLNLILPILVLPYLIKTLSINSYGIYSFVFAFTQFIVLFVDFGFNISATKKIAEHNDNHLLIKDTYWKITLIKFILAIISLILVCILFLFVPKVIMYIEGILYSYVMVFGTVLFPIWWFQGNNKMKQLSIISGVSKIITYPWIFVFVKEKNDYNNAIVIQSLSYLFAGIISICYLYINYKYYFTKLKLSTNIKLYKEEIIESFPIFFSNSTISLYTNSITIFLGVFSTEYNVGLFGAMERIVRMISIGVLSPINQVCFPIIAKLKRDSFGQAKKVFTNVFFVTAGIMILVYAIFLVFREEVIFYLFEGYKGIEMLLVIFMLMIFPISLGGVLGQLGLLALGGEQEKKIFSRIYIYVGILSTPITLILIYLFDLRGTIYAVFGVEVVIFLSFYIAVKSLKTKMY